MKVLPLYIIHEIAKSIMNTLAIKIDLLILVYCTNNNLRNRIQTKNKKNSKTLLYVRISVVLYDNNESILSRIDYLQVK